MIEYNKNGGINVLKAHKMALEQKTVDYIVSTTNEFIREGESDLFPKVFELIEHAELDERQTSYMFGYLKHVLSDENMSIQKQIKRDSSAFAKTAVKNVEDVVYSKVDNKMNRLAIEQLFLDEIEKRFEWVYKECQLEVYQEAKEAAENMFYRYFNV